jgi:hypothetical protein
VTSWPTLGLWVDFGGTLSNPPDPATTGDWTNVGSYVQAATVQRGMSRFEGVYARYEAGTCAVDLKNSDARFDPLNGSSPYAGQIKPRREYALQATWDGTRYSLWRGFADEWKPTYPLHGKDAKVLLRGTDGLSAFANAEGNGYVPIPLVEPDFTAGRIRAWISASEGLWIHDSIDVPGVAVQSVATLDGNVLAGMQLMADTEIGELYIAADGQVTFRLRNSLFVEGRKLNSQGTFNTGASLPFSDVELSYTAQGIRNHVTIQRVGGSAKVALDQDSIDNYQKRAFTRTDLLHTTDAESVDYAGYVLHLLKDPELRVDSLTLTPQSAPATLFPQLLSRELGDRITVAFTPPGGTAISRDCFIRGISHAVAPGSWKTKWTLQDASRFNFLVIDHATLGKFDSNALGY